MAAHAALRNGEWKRSKYTGIELYEKTVGIVGLGRIGVLVAQRLSAFGMKVIAYDPYVPPDRFALLGVPSVDYATLLRGTVEAFLPKHDIPLGEHRWLTVVGPDEPERRGRRERTERQHHAGDNAGPGAGQHDAGRALLPSAGHVITTAAGQRVRVRAGPFASREEAEQARERLKRLGIDAVMMARKS